MVNGRGLRRILLGPAGVHLVATAGAAAGFGVLLALIGSLLSPVTVSVKGHVFVAALMLGTLTFAYALRDFGLVRVPYPTSHRQVPREWFGRYSHRVTALYWGLGLGVGVTTMVPSGSLYVVLLWILVFGDPARGAALMLIYGFTRGLPPVISAWRLDWGSSPQFARLMGATRPLIAHCAGVVMATVAGILLTASVRGMV